MKLSFDERIRVRDALEKHEEILEEMKHSKVVRLAAFVETKKCINLAKTLLNQSNQIDGKEPA